jgi:hypothetical protein
MQLNSICTGSRTTNIKHAQLRMNCSKLNSHLYSLHVVDNPMCICGSDYEDPFHFFYMCPMFRNQRLIMFQAISSLNIDLNTCTIDMLLFGDENMDFETNTRLFKAVDAFIESTGRL